MKTKHASLALTAVTIASALLVAGCNDPSKDKSKATVSDPIATSPTTATTPSANANATAFQAVLFSQAAAPAATLLVFDQSTSKVQWTGSKVTGKHDGGFGAFTGSIQFVDGAPEKSKVTVDIQTDSLTSDAEKLTGHLKSADFFDTKTFPKASFMSTDIKKGGERGASHTVTGNLTLKGVTKSITFPATITTASDSASVDAEFSINRRDFSLNYPGMPNDLIRDNVVIKLSIRSKKG